MRQLHILSVGRDHYLMGVRSMVLRQAGYSVEEAFSSKDALRLLDSDSIDLALLCHTLGPATGTRLVADMHERRKLLPVICITARESDALPGCINVENSPTAMLNAIKMAATRLPGSEGENRVPARQ